jgi:hypothetical protein
MQLKVQAGLAQRTHSLMPLIGTASVPAAADLRSHSSMPCG